MNVTTISNMELQPDWQQPGTAGNTGGGSATGPQQGVMTPGTPAQFALHPTQPYGNAYWYRAVPGAWDGVAYFEYRLRFMLPTQEDVAACQAVEFELQQNVGGQIYNMAWQRRSGDEWYSFNYAATTWEASEIAVGELVAGQWVDVVATFLRSGAGVGAGTLTHLALQVDGKVNPVNVTRPAVARVESDYLNSAFQLDGNSAGAAYRCMVANVGVAMVGTQ